LHVWEATAAKRIKIIIIIINEERIRVTLSHRDVAGALYII